MKKLAHLYLSDKVVWRDHKPVAIEDENGYLFSQGRYRTKIQPDDLPEWYVYGRFYIRWGYMSAKGVKYLCYRPNSYLIQKANAGALSGSNGLQIQRPNTASSSEQTIIAQSPKSSIALLNLYTLTSP